METSENCEHNLTQTTMQQPSIDLASSKVAFYCAITCSCLGIFGNLITTMVLLGIRALRNHSTTPFLLSLAISDLMFSSIYLPLLAVRFHYRDQMLQHINSTVCYLFPFFLYTNAIISAYSMALVALNRYTGIYHQHLVPVYFTKIKSWLMVLGVWAFAGALMSLPLTETWGQMGYEPATFSCTVVPKDCKTPLYFLVTVGVVLPCAIMITCYGLILLKVYKTGRALRQVMNREDEILTRELSLRKMTLKREKQLTKTLFMICAAFVICFLPSALIFVIDEMPPSERAQLHVAGWVIFWCSAFINPIIYAVSNRTYRRSMTYFFKSYFLCQEDVERVTTWYEMSPQQEEALAMMVR